MEEFEMRFRLDRDVSGTLVELGFEKTAEFGCCDIIFEPKTWNPGDDLRVGYSMVRIRLVKNEKPKLEMKEYLEENLWNETSLEFSSVENMIKILSVIMNLKRYVLKNRTLWKKENMEVCIDDVKHLGSFIEIEGEKEDVHIVIKSLGLDASKRQPNYGTQLFYLERDGKISYSRDEIIKIANEFK